MMTMCNSRELYHRTLGKLKKYVRNKARPEGSIAEGYTISEALTYCSMYIRDIETQFNRPERNADNIEARPSSSISVFHQRARLFGKPKAIMLTQDEREKVRWYILNNTEKLQPYLE